MIDSNGRELLKQSFLVNYLEYPKWQESPDDFHLWVAMTLVGAATERKVVFDQKYFKVYPNLYTCLVSKSAISRKSIPMDMGMDIYMEALEKDCFDSNVLRGKITPSELISSISPKKWEAGSGVIFIQSDELGVFLSPDVRQAGLVEFLTRIYGCPEFDQYHTKTAGKYNMEDLFPSILSATLPSYVLASVGSAEEEGFVGRFTFIVKEGRKQSVAIVDRVADFPYIDAIKRVLVEQLHYINQKEGNIKLEDQAYEVYREWYDRIGEDREGVSTDIPMSTGFMGRKGTHALKLGMIFSLARAPMSDSPLSITKGDILAGIEFAEQAEKSLTKIFARKCGAGLMEFLNPVEEFLEKYKKVNKTILYNKFYRKIHSEDFDKILVTLQRVKVLLVRSEGRFTYYYYVDPDDRGLEEEEMVTATIERWETEGLRKKR